MVYRYTIAERVPAEEVEVTLLLSLIGIAALHGESQARLDAAHEFDAAARAATIDAGTVVGLDLNKLFAGYMAAEFGADSFTVHRADRARSPQSAKSQPEPVTA